MNESKWEITSTPFQGDETMDTAGQMFAIWPLYMDQRYMSISLGSFSKSSYVDPKGRFLGWVGPRMSIWSHTALPQVRSINLDISSSLQILSMWHHIQPQGTH